MFVSKWDSARYEFQTGDVRIKPVSKFDILASIVNDDIFDILVSVVNDDRFLFFFFSVITYDRFDLLVSAVDDERFYFFWLVH